MVPDVVHHGLEVSHVQVNSRRVVRIAIVLHHVLWFISSKSRSMEGSAAAKLQLTQHAVSPKPVAQAYLQNYNAQSVCVPVPALRVDLLVQSHHIKAKRLDGLHVKRQRLVRRSCTQACNGEQPPIPLLLARASKVCSPVPV